MFLNSNRLISLVLLSVVPLAAEEGMWTFDNPPRKQLEEKYQFTPTEAWLRHVQLSCVRFNDGGSGSFISPNGLVLTNHHVARGQLTKNSTQEHNYLETGFYAAKPEEELKSPDLEVNVLMSMENVTSRVQSKLQGKSTQEQTAARKEVFAAIEQESLEKTGLRSDVVTLYQGGEYWLYRYKKYTDVRIVFAPEQQTAFYGGDPDNFTYPRYDLDMAIFRVYENGQPIKSTEYLQWNRNGANDNDLVFVAGHPGRTERLSTLSQILTQRDTVEPLLLSLLQNRIAILQNYGAGNPDKTRQASALLFGAQNSFKAINGEHEGLLNKEVIAKKEQEEADFKKLVFSRPELKAECGNAWDAIAGAEQKNASRVKELYLHRISSQLFTVAQGLVEYVVEVKKPEGERLPGYAAAELESLRYRLLSPAPVYPELEKARIASSLQFAQQQLGLQDQFIQTILNNRTPEQVAAELVNNTKLADPAVRKKLLEGGAAAVSSSDDAMIVMARKIDPMNRELTKWFEDNVQSVEQQAGEQLGRARFQVYGKSIYPDATFTLRLSYGQVKGYPMNGTEAPPVTTFFGLYDRAASFGNQGPFHLMPRWQEGQAKLNLATPFNFVTTNDIIGGNSGSPVINRNGEIVGLIFDGNIESLVGDFVYEISTNRSVAVHTAAMTEALTKIYPTAALAQELLGSGTGESPAKSTK